MRGCRTAGAALCGLLLCACMDNRVYVRTDNSPGALFGISHLQPAKAPPALMDLGVSFKSAGRIVPSASDALYQTMRDGLARSRWTTRRLGDSARDFSDEIRAVVSAGAGTLPQPSATGAAAMPRMLVLVENAPDLSGGTQTRYFLSGMTFGAWSLNKPTDRYDVTVAYRDPQGVERVYRSHQDLLFSTGSKLFGRDEQGLQGLKHYDTPTAAFKGVVDNSVYGARHGTVTAGMPRFDAPKSAAPAAQPAAKAPPPVQAAAPPHPAAAQSVAPQAAAPRPVAQLPAAQPAPNVIVIVPAQAPKPAAQAPAAPPPVAQQAAASKPAALVPAAQPASNVIVIVPAQTPKPAAQAPAVQPAPSPAAPQATASKPAAQVPAAQRAPNVLVIVPAQTPKPVAQPQAVQPAPQPAAKPAAPATATAPCGTGKTGSCPARP